MVWLDSYASWNEIVTTERRKFDIAKFFGVQSVKYDLSAVAEPNKLPDPETMVVSAGDEGPGLTEETVRSMAKNYSPTVTEGTGLVFIVERFSKVDNKAHVYVVKLDLAAKTVYSIDKVSAKATGIGVRNYWANSLWNVMRSY